MVSLRDHSKRVKSSDLQRLRIKTSRIESPLVGFGCFCGVFLISFLNLGGLFEMIFGGKFDSPPGYLR